MTRPPPAPTPVPRPRASRATFLGIGAQKSATSWLHAVMAAHPQIAASDPKELDFFTAHWDRGALWYERHFARPAGARARGECSPGYFASRDAPARAAEYNPDLALIAVLRDPVARMFSNHLHEIRKGHIPPDTAFETALAANPAYRAQSRYQACLGRWIEAFGRDRLLVLLAEDLDVDPVAGWRAVCRHLGVAEEPVPDAIADRRNESVAHRSEVLQSGLRRGGDALRAAGMGPVVRALKRAPGLSGVLALNQRDLRQQVAPMRPDTRAALAAEFAGDIAFVRDLLGRDALPWPSARR